MRQLSDIKLVHPGDASYRAVQSHFAKQYRDERPRDPFAAQYNKTLMTLEEGMRRLLGERTPIQEERILSYLQSGGRPTGQKRCYREIDCVMSDAGDPWLFVEIKCPIRRAFSKGTAQLNKSLTVGREQWPSLQGLWLSVTLEFALGLEGEPLVEIQALRDVSLEPSVWTLGQDPPVVWVDGVETIELAQDRGFLPRTFMDRSDRRL